MTKKFLSLIFIMALFQIIMIGHLGLAHDEAYYWLYSQDLSWGYFDHPPFVAWVIKAFSFLPHSEFSLRVGFVLLHFLSLLIILKTVNKESWTEASLLYFSFPLVTYAANFALPDIPLVFMGALYLWALYEYLQKATVGKAVLLGFSIAFLCYAKYHGILFVFFTVLALPKLALKKEFYISAAVAIILLIPHLLWQIDHDFATFRYHFVERPSSSFSFKRTLEFIGLQVVLAGVLAGPLVWKEVIKAPRSDFNRVLKFISIGSILFFIVSSFSKKVEANWTIYLAVAIVPLIAGSSAWKNKWYKNLLLSSFILVLTLRLIFFFPQWAPKRIHEFYGWDKWAQEIEVRCENLALLGNSYQIASKLSFYLNKKVHSLNYRSRKNQFDYYGFEKLYGEEERVCYITDKEFLGEEVKTPEGVQLKLVKDFTMMELLEKKREWEDNRK